MRCFEYLIGKDVQLPRCYYKSDLAHLFKTLNYFRGQKTKLSFYKRCISFISQITSLADFRQAAVALFAISKCANYVEGSLCHDYLISMGDAIRTHTLPDEQIEIADELKSDKFGDEEPSTIKNLLTAFVGDIIAEADKCAASSVQPIPKKSESTIAHHLPQKPNAYYCKHFEKNFKSLCQKFPSWTNVLAAAYGYDGDELNSARSEGFFRIRKVQNPHPVTIIRYLLRETKKIESSATRDYPSLKKVTLSGDRVDIPGESVFDLSESEEE